MISKVLLCDEISERSNFRSMIEPYEGITCHRKYILCLKIVSARKYVGHLISLSSRSIN